MLFFLKPRYVYSPFWSIWPENKHGVFLRIFVSILLYLIDQTPNAIENSSDYDISG